MRLDHSRGSSRPRRFQERSALVTIASTRPPNRWPPDASRRHRLRRAGSSGCCKLRPQGVGEQLATEIFDELPPLRRSEMYLRNPSMPTPPLPSGKIGPRIRRAGRPLSRSRRGPDRVVFLESQPDRVKAPVAGRAAFMSTVPGQKLRQGVDSPVLRLIHGQLGPVRRRRRIPRSEDAADSPVPALHRAAFAGPANSWSRTWPSATAHRDQTDAAVSTRTQSSDSWPESGHAVVFRQQRIDERMVGVNEVEHRAIVARQVHEEPDGLTPASHAWSSFENAGKLLAVDAVVFFKPPELQPLPAKSAARPRGRGRRGPCDGPGRRPPRAGADWPAARCSSSSRSGMLDQRK